MSAIEKAIAMARTFDATNWGPAPTSSLVAQRYIELPHKIQAVNGGTNENTRQMREEYRIIKRRVLDNAFDHKATPTADRNLIMITSSVGGEGKTFTSINLALSIAKEIDRTVLLVDTDVVRSGISTALGFERGAGLADILAGDVTDLGEALIKTNEPKLTLISAGEHRPDIAELFGSKKMQALIDTLSARFADSVILFDSPPLLQTSEARVITSLMGQILIVVEAGQTSQLMVEEAVSCVDPSKNIGLILNKGRRVAGQNYYGGYGYSMTE